MDVKIATNELLIAVPISQEEETLLFNAIFDR